MMPTNIMDNKKDNKLSNFIIWGIAIITVVLFCAVIAGVYYCHLKRGNRINPKFSAISNAEDVNLSDTSGWYTYTSTSFGFSLKYPLSYPVKKIGDGGFCIDKNQPSDNPEDQATFCQDGSGLIISIVGSKGESLADYVAGWQSGRGPDTDYKHEATQVNGQDAIRVTDISTVCNEIGCDDVTTWTLKDNKILSFGYSSNLSDLQTLIRIITTFQFSAPSVGWRAHIDSQDGYQFEYPANGLTYGITETKVSDDNNLLQMAERSLYYNISTMINVLNAKGSDAPKTLEDYIGEFGLAQGDSTNLNDYNKTEIDGQTAYFSKNGLLVLFAKGNNIYRIDTGQNISQGTGYEKDKELSGQQLSNNPTYRHVLSTFHFAR